MTNSQTEPGAWQHFSRQGERAPLVQGLAEKWFSQHERESMASMVEAENALLDQITAVLRDERDAKSDDEDGDA